MHRARGRLEEAQQQPSGRRFAATRLADECERFADTKFEAHAVDGAHDAGLPREKASPHWKVLDQIVDAQQWRCIQRSHAATTASALKGTRQHAASWPPPTSMTGGSSTPHPVPANGQTELNLH